MNGRLRNRRVRKFKTPEEINPLDGAINIVDAMLVFACGLMLSLIIHWNVDFDQSSSRVDLAQGQEVTQEQAEEIQENQLQNQTEGKIYQVMGTVYKDPATGKLFMLTQ